MREYFLPLRPGDTFRAVDQFLGIKEKSNPDRPYRMFIRSAARKYYNQNDQLAFRGYA